MPPPGDRLRPGKWRRHFGTITSKKPLVVEWTPQQWSYALSCQIWPPAEAAVAPPWQPLKVVVKTSVESGALGCLLVADDWTTVLGPRPPSLRKGPHTIELFFQQPSETAHLVFRNDGPDEASCVFAVEQVLVVPDDASESRWSFDLVDGPPPRIDMDALRRCVTGQGGPLADDVAVLDRLRRRRQALAAAQPTRLDGSRLRALSDAALIARWSAACQEAGSGDGFARRGWYQLLYRDALRGRTVLDVGSEMAFDGIELARNGAQVTFVDVLEDNLAVLERLCALLELPETRFFRLRSLASLDDLPEDFDAVFLDGSEVDVPFDFARRTSAALASRLKTGGRWLERAYPRERWERDGCPPFDAWGTLTDGEGAAWMEWYDTKRLLDRLAPVRFEPVLALDFHDGRLNWFDLRKLD